MKITKKQLRRIIREQDEGTPGGNVIGIITANIDGDSRYNQQLTVTHDPSTDEVTILVQDAGAVGGMDYQGPGEGRGAYHTIGKQVLPAGTNGKGLVAAIRHMIKRRADTIKRYGQPTKNFTWGESMYSSGPKGLSATLGDAALKQSRGIAENMKITKRQLRRIIREAIDSREMEEPLGGWAGDALKNDPDFKHHTDTDDIPQAAGVVTPEAWADQNGLQVEIHHSGEKIIYLDNKQADALDMPPGVDWDLQQNYDGETWTIYTGEY